MFDSRAGLMSASLMSGAPSLTIAFVGGLVSFLSPCVLPLVPSHVAFVSGMTLDELAQGGGDARRRAALHSALFILGFGVVFVALGATATLLGSSVRRYLPVVQAAGGVLMAVFGLTMLGLIRPSFMLRERQIHIRSKRGGALGSIAVGAAFGAAWTPCVGPLLATILLYAGMTATMGRGLALLVTYTLGLGLPFMVAAVSVNWFLATSRRLRPWLQPLERMAGALLIVIGVALVTGHFASLTSYLAGFGQLISVER